MKSLVQLTIVLAVLTLVKSFVQYKGIGRCNFPCYFKKSVCGSNGKTYQSTCELLNENCRTRKNIKVIKHGKCPVCSLKEPLPRCIVAACFNPHCPAYPEATCVSFCPCIAEYYYKLRKVNCHPAPISAPTTNLCHLKFCGVDGICKVVNGKAICVSKGAVCSLPKVVGPCKARFPRFYYNSKTQQCETFYYGGCRSNKNNFKTEELCEDTCKPRENVCSLPKVVGPCKGSIRRYYHNSKTRRCERFFYGGCGGNRNNFDTLSQCKRACATKDPCASIRCRADRECKVILGTARCRPILANPCIAILCIAGRKCVVVNGEGRCVSSTSSCAAVSCLKGNKCIINNGRPTCVPRVPTRCSSNPDCKQQGSFCNKNRGVCKCYRFCLAIHQPVCGSDGKRYSSPCQLDIAACRKKTTITSASCSGDIKSTQ